MITPFRRRGRAFSVSVAFRRESDEEHKEPRFEIPIPPGPNLVTPRGLRLVSAKIAESEAALAAAAEETQREEHKRDLRYWRARLASAQLAPVPPADEIAFGSRARIRLNGAERVIDIVGDDEADPAAGRLAFSAPLARALIGSAIGEYLDFAGKKNVIEVLDIENIPDEI
jgi:transcription elongation GreA/GreB family factor